MDSSEQDGNGAPEALPSPPEALPPPPPLKAEIQPKVFRAPMARRGLGTKGNKVPILTNHFKVNVNSSTDGYFFHYSVCILNSSPILIIVLWMNLRELTFPYCLICRLRFSMRMAVLLTRRVWGEECLIEFMRLTFLSWMGKISPMMAKKVCLLLVHFRGTNTNMKLSSRRSPQAGAYNICCLSPCLLLFVNLLLLLLCLCIVVDIFLSFLKFRNNVNASPGSPNENDKKRIRRPYNSKTFKVEISFAAKIPMQAIANALRGQESENSQEAIRVLDIILRQHAAKK